MPSLSLSFQNVSAIDNIPKRYQFMRWVNATIRIDTEVNIRIVDEDEGRMLNLTYRGKDYPTNVLTFPLIDEPHLMGDIVICAPIVAKEAAEQNKPLEAHFAHLTVHGTLHLHGYDHISEKQAHLMESIEVTTLQELGYPNSYLVTQDA